MWAESESESSDVEFSGFKDLYEDYAKNDDTKQVDEEESAVSKEQQQANADNLAGRLIGDAIKSGNASIMQIKQALVIGMAEGRAGERQHLR